MRRLLLLGLLITGGCAVTVPSGQPFSDTLIEAPEQDESVLFIYSMPGNAKHLYKYVFIDGEHKSTITVDTFSRITLKPGRHRIRILQHGWKSPEPWILRGMNNESVRGTLEATTDIKLGPGSVNFLNIGRGERKVYSACAESQTATQVCSEEITGLVIDEVPQDTAVLSLSGLREVSKNCE